MPIFSCGPYSLSLERPLLMGIVNLTPDSFSGDGCGADARLAIEHARLQLDAGADILDIGAESSRPGAMKKRKLTACVRYCAKLPVGICQFRLIPTSRR